ncbi:MAG: chorismate synthase [Paludibacteraceae bacterium]|nr:chorismate synthase [Paludibacteraceae bacterium]
MRMNTFGEYWTFTSFGESHGPAVGGVLDGVPAGITINLALIHSELARRRGEQQAGVSPRAQVEKDEVEWLSGVKDGITLGTPIAFIIRNTNTREQDYEWLRTHYRPGHADYTYQVKYGIRDWRGGGRASARETAARVVAGNIAKQQLAEKNIAIQAQLIQIGTETNPQHFDQLLKVTQQAGDSIGGIVECHIAGVSAGVGEPIFDKLQSHLAAAMLSINGCKGFEYGTGFDMTPLGSSLYKNAPVPCPTSGGIEGGISNGLDIVFRCAFKPAASITQLYKGRHDSCIAVRAVPVVEAMTALVLINLIR